MTVEQALSQIDRSEKNAARCEQDVVTREGELETFEQQAAVRLVDEPGEAETLTEEIVRLRTGLELARRTAVTAAEQLLDARRDVLRARAGEHRAEMVRLRADADQREARTRELLAELAEHEGCEFTPGCPPGSTWPHRTRTMLTRLRATTAETQAADLERLADTGKPLQIEQKAAAIAAKNKAPAPATVAG
ncbi:hypothetical protein [Streptosporangium sp. NPDC006930]|uniref:hypothetical protein n=1 Tax=Streptosporangium sp. NPDC006930 TaxID=3154783 RepID=UPI0034198F8F